MKPQINEIKRMQQLAGIKSLNESRDYNAMDAKELKALADAGDSTAERILKKMADDEYQLRKGQESNPDEEGNCSGNTSFVPGYGCMEEGKECPDCEKNESFDKLDEIVDKVLAKIRKN